MPVEWPITLTVDELFALGTAMGFLPDGDADLTGMAESGFRSLVARDILRTSDDDLVVPAAVQEITRLKYRSHLAILYTRLAPDEGNSTAEVLCGTGRSAVVGEPLYPGVTRFQPIRGDRVGEIVRDLTLNAPKGLVDPSPASASSPAVRFEASSRGLAFPSVWRDPVVHSLVVRLRDVEQSLTWVIDGSGAWLVDNDAEVTDGTTLLTATAIPWRTVVDKLESVIADVAEAGTAASPQSTEETV